MINQCVEKLTISSIEIINFDNMNLDCKYKLEYIGNS